jgi:nucleolar protein 4
MNFVMTSHFSGDELGTIIIHIWVNVMSLYLQRPMVAFSIENKAVMNIKQKRLEKSQAKNPLYTDQHIAKCNNKKSKLLQSDEDLEQQGTKNGNVGQEETEEFVGVTAKPGNTKLRTRFGLQTEAKIHKQAVHNAKHRQKLKSRFVQRKHSNREQKKDPQVSITKMQNL